MYLRESHLRVFLPHPLQSRLVFHTSRTGTGTAEVYAKNLGQKSQI